MGFLTNILMLESFAKYRRIIGIILLLVGVLVERVVCDANILEVIPSLGGTCSSGTKVLATVIQLFGGYAGIVGIIKTPKATEAPK